MTAPGSAAVPGRATAAVLVAALQRLLVVAAAVVLLGHGGVEVSPRLTSPASGVVASAGSASRPAAESKPVAAASTLRTALAVQAPGGAGDTAAGPGSSPLVAPHLLARPAARPPTASYALHAGGRPSGRAPPAPAGT